MSPVFKEDDSPVKKTVMVAFWIVCAIVALKVVGVLLPGLVWLLVAAVWFGPAIWVYWHAQSRDVSGPFLWALLALFTHVVGLVVYLIVNSDDGSSASCPTCGSQAKRSYQRCPHCGSVLPHAPGRCASCGHRLKPEWDFCTRCGTVVPKTPASIIT